MSDAALRGGRAGWGGLRVFSRRAVGLRCSGAFTGIRLRAAENLNTTRAIKATSPSTIARAAASCANEVIDASGCVTAARSAARAMASVVRAGAISRRQLRDTSTRGGWCDRGDNTSAVRAGRGRSAGPDSHRLRHLPGRPSNLLQGQLRGAPASSALFASAFLLTTPGNHLLVSVALDFGPNGPSMRPSGGRVATRLPLVAAQHRHDVSRAGASRRSAQCRLGGRLMRVIGVGCFLKVETFHAYYLCEYFDQTNSSLFGERLAYRPHLDGNYLNYHLKTAIAGHARDGVPALNQLEVFDLRQTDTLPWPTTTSRSRKRPAPPTFARSPSPRR